MSDHAHVLFSLAHHAQLPAVMHAIKCFSALSVNRMLGRTGQVWQRESFDRALRRDEEVGRYVEYIIENAMRGDVQPYPWIWLAAGFRGQ